MKIEAINTAYNAQNVNYIARKGASAKLNKSGMQSDISKGMGHFTAFTAPMFDAITALGISEQQICDGIKKTRNVKVALRLPQLLAFIASGSVDYLQGSAKTCLYETAALVMGAKTRAALFFAATGKGDENTSDVISVARVRKLQKLAGLIGASTEQTQNSVSFAHDNLGDVLGIAHKAGRTDLPVINADSPVLLALIKRIDALTDLDLERLQEKSKAKGAKGK